ncbi:MAG: tRNA epoxyqueuosine(34) reductase QueG [Dysgonomonas sp.]|nr:tRNA epoxyqueuosine(34) reductase QueG [Dysgonomonas sp.]
MITSQQIKEYAYSLGFDACGICKAEPIEEVEQQHVKNWIDKAYFAGMDYMTRNIDKRCDPTLLVENARSIICVALNYYPKEKQPEDHPQFAYYAYGKDYHDVVKDKLRKLFDYIKETDQDIEGGCFVDTAPVLERYWAAKAGLGFIGKNSLLIQPKKGSYFFLGELIVDKELDYDVPINLSCGNCRRCIDACPTGAIVSPSVIDANKCISYQTIENKGKIDERIKPLLNNCIYGCDICQQVCPWNRYSKSHKTSEFSPKQAFLDLSYNRMEELTEEEYRDIFRGSAVKRAKYSGLKRNLQALKNDKEII